MTQTARCKCNKQCQGYRSNDDNRNLAISSKNVVFNIPKLKRVYVQIAIMERYRRWESTVIEMYLEDISFRHTAALDISITD